MNSQNLPVVGINEDSMSKQIRAKVLWQGIILLHLESNYFGIFTNGLEESHTCAGTRSCTFTSFSSNTYRVKGRVCQKDKEGSK